MFRGVKIYTVHIRPEEPLSRQAPVFVREGFNIWAFLFTGLWALYQRLWGPLILLLALHIVLAVLLKNHILSVTGVAALEFGIHLLVGFHGNDWVRSRLFRQGFILADVTAADSRLRAEQRYFERTLAAA